MASPLGKLTAVLGLDAREFSGGIDRAKKDVGGFGVSAQTAFKVGGAAAALGFGLMTKGALEMESAQGKFQAATGRSREEAIAFSKDMNSLTGTAGTVGRSFAEISAAGIAVSQQFGITGEKATELTGHILAFAKVTGQDAEQAAFQLEDTLSAFGMTADDAAGFMDKLVLSNQKFGTDAGPETLGVLQNMAPALVAMGMGLDDGVELLNAFEVAGVDAGTAQRGLQTAIDELEPGQNLDDLITKIGAIEDPTLRAQAAIDIFGTRAGAGLAAVIKPGMTSLDEFGVTADEAAGSVDDAANDMLTTTDKFKMFAEKIGGFFRDTGQMFGPLLSGLGAVGGLIGTQLGKAWGVVSKSGAWKAAAGAAGAAATAVYNLGMKAVEAIGGALSAAWSAIVNSPIVKAVAGAAGAVAGAAYGIGMKVMEAITGPLSAAFMAIGRVGSGVVVAAATSGGIAGTAFGLAFAAAAVFAVPLLAKEFGDKTFDALQGVLGGPTRDEFMDRINARMAETGAEAGTTLGTEAGAAVTPAMTQALGPFVPPGFWAEQARAAGSEAGHQSSDSFGDSFNLTETAGDEMTRFRNMMVNTSKAAANAAHDALADELIAGIPDTRSAWDQYKDATKNALDPMKEIAWLEARLSGDKLKAGLESKNPLVVRQSEIMRDQMVAELAQLKTLLGIEGEEGGAAVGNGIGTPQNKTNASNNAQRIATAARDGFTTQPWNTWGANAYNQWESGFLGDLSKLNAKIRAQIRVGVGALISNSPVREGPLRDLGRWGKNAAREWIDPFVDEFAKFGRLTGALGSLAPRGSIPRFTAPGFTPALASAGTSVDVGGITIHVNGSTDPQGTADAVAEKVNEVLGGFINGAYQARHVRFSTSTS